MAEHLSGHIMQDNDLSEFDESREIIEGLVDEYKACESPDYIKWGMEVILVST
jgi:tubulin gamma